VIQAESKDVVNIGPPRERRANIRSRIKQCRVAQDAVKQLDGKSAIWPAQLRLDRSFEMIESAKRFLLANAQRVQRNSASRQVRHAVRRGENSVRFTLVRPME